MKVIVLRNPGCDSREPLSLILFERLLQLLVKTEIPDALVIFGALTGPAGSADRNRAAVATRMRQLVAAKTPVPLLAIRGDGDFPDEMFGETFAAPAAVTPLGRESKLVIWRAADPGVLRRARENFAGNILCLLPADESETAELAAACEASRAFLLRSAEVPDFSAEPHAWLELDWQSAAAPAVNRADFRLPAGYDWIDGHTHTPFAYCGENMDLELENRLFDRFNLYAAVVTEHSGQLCYSPRGFWDDWVWFDAGNAHPGRINRLPDYLEYCRRHASKRHRIGLEVDFDRHGRPLLPENFTPDWRWSLGATHRLGPELSPRDQAGQLLFLVGAMGRCGVRVLAHPLRALTSRKIDPAPYYDRLTALLRQYGMAMEINFHHQSYDYEFTRRCIDGGVKLTLGSDSHNLTDFGLLQPHLKLLRDIGFDGDYRDILFDYR